MIPLIDEDICTGCERCREVCPPQAIETAKKKVRIEVEFCEECGFCAAECPEGAIHIPFPKGST